MEEKIRQGIIFAQINSKTFNGGKIAPGGFKEIIRQPRQ